MGISQKYLRKLLYIEFVICTLVLLINLLSLLNVTNIRTSVFSKNENNCELSGWKEESSGVYVMERFDVSAYFSLRKYLNKVEDKRIILFEVRNGNAKVIFKSV